MSRIEARHLRAKDRVDLKASASLASLLLGRRRRRRQVGVVPTKHVKDDRVQNTGLVRREAEVVGRDEVR